MAQNRIWELLAKKLSGEADVHELEELQEILRASPEMHYPMQTISDMWFFHPGHSEDANAAYERHLARRKEQGIRFETANPVLQQTESDEILAPRNNSWRAVLWIGISIVVLGIGGLYWLNRVPSPVTVAEAGVLAKSEVSTRNGSKSKVVLPDGSQVWLNSGSKIIYGKEFGVAGRELTLIGEAFFDVAKNPAKPFIIHARNIDIRVVGTAFNVKSYPGDKTTETSLIRGIVEVSIKNRPKEKIILKPNEKLVVAIEEKLHKQSAKTAQLMATKKAPQVVIDNISFLPLDSTVVETSWMDNKLIFRDESFEDLALKMERWYGVSFRFGDRKLEALRFTGIFQGETLQQALKALRITASFNYRIEKDVVTIE